MTRPLAILLLATALCATDSVPYWCLAGILAKESHSYYDERGQIVYVDKRRGSAGELSSFQITHGAWLQVRRPGDRFADLATDQVYAERIAMDYLIWLYDHTAHKSWPHAVQQYHRGPGRYAYSYYVSVAKLARQAGYRED